MVVGCLETVTDASFVITFATDTAICPQDSRSAAGICLRVWRSTFSATGSCPQGCRSALSPSRRI